MKLKNILLMTLMSVKLMGMDGEDLSFTYSTNNTSPEMTVSTRHTVFLRQFTPENINETDELGVAIIHYVAILDKNVGFLRGLIAKGADINLMATGPVLPLKTKDGVSVDVMSPVYFAARSGAFDNLRILVDAGASLAPSRKEGDPFLYANDSLVLKTGINVMHMVFTSSDFLSRTLPQRCIDIINFLMGTGKIDINTPGLLGQTVLHIACERGQVEIVKLFMERGANETILDYDGWSPLRAAQDSLYNRRINHDTYHGIKTLFDFKQVQEQRRAAQEAEMARKAQIEETRKALEAKKKAEKDKKEELKKLQVQISRDNQKSIKAAEKARALEEARLKQEAIEVQKQEDALSPDISVAPADAIDPDAPVVTLDPSMAPEWNMWSSPLFLRLWIN